MASPAKTGAAAGEFPSPLDDPRERAIALHESSHCIAALARRKDVASVTTCRAGTLLATEGGTFLRGATFAAADPIVYFAGVAGACLANGIPYEFADIWQTRLLRCSRRATAKQRLADAVSSPKPGTVTESAWAPTPSDGAALSVALHSTGTGDLIDALEHIERDAAEIEDAGERNFFIESEWHAAQAEALKLCTSWLPEIKALAALLCQRGGVLTEAEIQEFWQDARQSWAQRQAEKVIERLKREKTCRTIEHP